METKHIRFFRFLMLIIAIILFGIIIYDAWDMSLLLIKTKNINVLKHYLEEIGAGGILVIMTLSAVQLFIPILPSMLIQLSAGAIYGLIFGTIICLIGYVFGNLMAFRVATLIINHDYKNQKTMHYINKFKCFFNIRNKLLILYLIFLIPILPNVVKPYFGVLFKINTFNYVVICLLGSIVPIFLGILIGDGLMNNNFLGVVVGVGIVIVCATLAAYLNNRFKSKEGMD